MVGKKTDLEFLYTAARKLDSFLYLERRQALPILLPLIVRCSSVIVNIWYRLAHYHQLGMPTHLLLSLFSMLSSQQAMDPYVLHGNLQIQGTTVSRTASNEVLH